MSKLAMEFIGTFFLCLTVGTSAAFSNLAPLAIGGVLMCFIYAGAHISGANYNPAVSFALALRGALPWTHFIFYIITQLLASCIAGVVGLTMLLDQVQDTDGVGKKMLGHPRVDFDKFSASSAVLAEVFYTFALCFVVLNVATTKVNSGNQFFGLAIGFTVTAGACAGGPVSGGAFNPAVGFGLNLVSGDFAGMWIYQVGPYFGAALAAGAFYLTNLEEFRKDSGYEKVATADEVVDVEAPPPPPLKKKGSKLDGPNKTTKAKK
jgi:aquaporin Z